MEPDAVVALTGVQVRADRPAVEVGGQVQLGGEPAAGTPEGFPLTRGLCAGRRQGFDWSAGGRWRAPAACWWARTTVLSTLMVQSPPSSRSASRRRRSGM